MLLLKTALTSEGVDLHASPQFPDLLAKFQTIDVDNSSTISWEELKYYALGGSESAEAWLELKLSTVVGLEQLKEQLKRFQRAVLLDQNRRKKGMTIDESGAKLHMIFVSTSAARRTKCQPDTAETAWGLTRSSSVAYCLPLCLSRCPAR